MAEYTLPILSFQASRFVGPLLLAEVNLSLKMDDVGDPHYF